MTDRISLSELADDIRNIYRTDPSQAELLTRQYLVERFREHSSAEKQALLEQLIKSLEDPAIQTGSDTQAGMAPKIGTAPQAGMVLQPGMVPQTGIAPHTGPDTRTGHESSEFSRLFSQLVGIPVAREDLSSTELLAKLTSSLTVIFDTLNQIIGVINTTLLGRKPELETIRQIIGSTLEGENCSTSLKNYLDQIKKAFFAAHQAFQQAASTKIREILSELSPDQIEAAAKGSGIAHGFKFGPLRKAELYESYKERHQACMRWLESGRLMEELLREFEKVCQKIY
ncbi:MAG: hypothetical protein AB1847_03045 [bacterium]